MKKQDNLAAKTFPGRLTALMKERGCTQEELSKSVGVRRQTISLYQTGKTRPDYVQLAAIAAHFGVSSDYLIGLSEYRSDQTAFATPAQLGLDEAAAEALRRPFMTTPSDDFREMQNRLISSGDFADIVSELLRLQAIAQRCRLRREQEDQKSMHTLIEQFHSFREMAELINQKGETLDISEFDIVLPEKRLRYAFLDAVERIKRIVEDETGYNPREWEEEYNGNDPETR